MPVQPHRSRRACRARCSGWPRPCGRWATTSGCSARATGRPPRWASSPSATASPPRPTGRWRPSPPTRRAPCAPSPPCATSTSTSSTCTSRSPPGRTVTCVVLASASRWSARSTPPARAPPTGCCGPSPAGWPAASTSAARCPRTPRPWPCGLLGGDVRASCSTASRSSASPRPPRGRPTGPTVLFLSRHESRKGLDVLLGALARAAGRRPAVGGQRRAGDGRLKALDRRRPPGGVAGPHRRRRAGGRGCGAPTCSAPRRCGASPSGWCCWRAWPPQTPVVASDLPGYRNVAGGGEAGGRSWSRPATPVALAGALDQGPRRAVDRPPRLVAAGEARAASSPWTTWPSATSSSTSRPSPALAGPPSRRRPRAV